MPREASRHGVILGNKKDGFRGSIVVDGTRKYVRGQTRGAVQERLSALVEKAAADKLLVERAAYAEQGWQIAFDGWMASSSLAVTTIQSHKKLVSGILAKSDWWSKAILDTTTAEIDAWVDGLRNRHGEAAAWNTKNMVVSIAKNTAAYALRTGRFGMTANPVADVAVVRRNVTEHVSSLSRSQVRSILEAARELSPHAAARWSLALHLGLRPAECLGLVLDDVERTPTHLIVTVQATLVRVQANQFTETLWVRQAATKTKAGRRRIPIPTTSVPGMLLNAHLHELARQRAEHEAGDTTAADDYLHELRVALAKSVKAGLAGTDAEKPLSIPADWLFPHPDAVDRPRPQDSDRAEWKRLCTAAEISPLPTRYAARHTAATHLMDQPGVDPLAVADILGHASLEFSRARYADGLDQRTVAFLDTTFGGVARPVGTTEVYRSVPATKARKKRGT